MLLYPGKISVRVNLALATRHNFGVPQTGVCLDLDFLGKVFHDKLEVILHSGYLLST
jgi:hypothetical protein